MVSNASELLPEPDRPVITTSASRGSDREMSFRLCSRAPETTIWLPAGICRSFYEATRYPKHVRQVLGFVERYLPLCAGGRSPRQPEQAFGPSREHLVSGDARRLRAWTHKKMTDWRHGSRRTREHRECPVCHTDAWTPLH